MNRSNINLIALAIGLSFSVSAIAQNMSKEDYNAGKDRIATVYKTDKAACASLSGNANDICIADSNGIRKVALAEIDATYKPGYKSRYEVRVAKAEAAYAVSRERCDDKAGNAKDVCVKKAKAAQTAAKADAKAQMKISGANAVANEKSAEARHDADTKTAAARKSAAADKADADYSVAKEKCDTFAGTAKDNCLDQAKAHFGKS